MAGGNEDTARRFFAALNREDFEAAIELVHPAVELVPPGGQPPYRGAERVRRWMEPEAFQGQVVEVLETAAASPTTILSRHHVTARGRASGIELDVISWSVLTFDEDGRITRVRIYMDHERDRAREAAGLAD